MNADQLYEELLLTKDVEDAHVVGFWSGDMVYSTRGQEPISWPPHQFYQCSSYFHNRNKKEPKSVVYRNAEGKVHRLYGPAVVCRDYDYEVWVKNGLIHREDSGPAIRHRNTFIWMKDGQYHREDGPAIVSKGGPKEYWLDGMKFSIKQYKWEIERRKRKGVIK